MSPRGQEGFTLPELLVVIAILPIVLVALLTAVDTSAKLAPRTVEYANAVEEAGGGLARAVRELRQTYRVVGTTPNSVTFLTAVSGTETQVNITCGVDSTEMEAGVPLKRCVRTTAPVGSALPAPVTGAVLIDRMLNGTAEDPVFQYSPNPIHPTFVRMLVKVPSRGEGSQGTRLHPITIDDGTLLRNNALGT
jgi:prepilin-type N-terminal cleavage/methylation domain-containing protein